jgi:capsule polysaccharide export protein KpsE/RkpR
MNRNKEGETSGGFDLSSKFWRTFLVIVAAFLIFAGPTYVPYVLVDMLKVNYAASMVSGFILLVAGLVLMLYLVRKKIIL